MMARLWWGVTLLLSLCFSLTTCDQQPNIILIVSDDLGYNDVGYHGSPEIKTPNIDKLAEEGVKLENYYVQPICTPSRSQLLTGMYQIHTGMQHGVIMPCQRNGLPLQYPTMADTLKRVGYATHIVGKWHLGMFREAYLPTRRGFDSFFGYFTGAQDHYTHYTRYFNYNGLDFHEDEKPYNGSYGLYSTPVFTKRAQSIIQSHNKSKPLFLYLPYQNVHDPLEVPAHYEQKFSNIKSKARRTFAGMVSAMDEGIGNITETLKSTGLWNNTLIVFTNDNGAYVQLGGGNNAPFRGGKYTYFEGGVKGVGFVSGPVLKKPGRVSNELMHVSDWYITLTHMAGGSPYGTDGYDMWNVINEGRGGKRQEIIYNIDTLFPRKGKTISDVFDTSIQAAYRYKDWKILTGDVGYDGWAPEPTSSVDNPTLFQFAGNSSDKNVYVFNIKTDPEERHDLSEDNPGLVNSLLLRLAKWYKDSKPPFYPPDDKKCDPALRGGVWGPWM